MTSGPGCPAPDYRPAISLNYPPPTGRTGSLLATDLPAPASRKRPSGSGLPAPAPRLRPPVTGDRLPIF